MRQSHLKGNTFKWLCFLLAQNVRTIIETNKIKKLAGVKIPFSKITFIILYI